MKILNLILLLPFFAIAQENVSLFGNIILSNDGKEILLETKDCQSAYRYYLDLLPQDNKINRKIKKNNAKVNDLITSFINKASNNNGIINDVNIKGKVMELDNRMILQPQDISQYTYTSITTVSNKFNKISGDLNNLIDISKNLVIKCKFLSHTKIINDVSDSLYVFWDHQCNQIFNTDSIIVKDILNRLYEESNIGPDIVKSMSTLKNSLDQINLELKDAAHQEQMILAYQISKLAENHGRLLEDNVRISKMLKHANETLNLIILQ
tara:strand:+ start:2381 stop:3181 length:801 start_codon:yes stop_codon:yes gene_type:complete